MLLPPRTPPGSPAPTVVPGAASDLHDVLLLPLLIRALVLLLCTCGYWPVLLLLLLLLLCLEYVFAANLRGHGNMQVNPSR